MIDQDFLPVQGAAPRGRAFAQGAARRALLASSSLAALGLALVVAMPSRASEWRGAVSTNWFDPANWIGGVPTAATLAGLNAITPNPTVIDAAAAQTSELFVGDLRTGMLTIQGGGSLAAGGVGFIGGSGTSGSSVTVTGPGSSLALSTSLVVGANGSGTLTIQNGGAVSNATFASIGQDAGHAGAVTVDGAGSTWTSTGTLTVGESGAGTLSILNGGKVSNTDGNIGLDAVSTGTVTVDGAGSTWTSTGTLTVGESGAGTLSILNGGKVSNTDGNIGLDAVSTGTVTVDGAGSTWTSTGTLTVGESGAGTLSILNGGKVSNTDGNIGLNAGSTGTVTVDSAGSMWTSTGPLTIGDTGKGTLSIQNGGAVNSAGSAIIGKQAGATGSATISGKGSTWTNSGTIAVGSFGAGTMLLQNGGTVSNTSGAIGSFAGSSGTVIVDGSGSTWTNSGDLRVGVSGNGTLSIQNGGEVRSFQAVSIGQDAGSTGNVTISGAGSIWRHGGGADLLVGDSGTGTLSILNGGGLSNAVAGIGRVAGSTGSAIVDGAGSTWSSSRTLFVGVSGTGSLTIQNGGTVTSQVGVIGTQAGSSGSVSINGPGSSWSTSSSLIVGARGTGTLTLQNGAVVNAGGPVFLAQNAGSIGTINIGSAIGQAATAPGSLNTSAVTFGGGSGRLVFNHTSTNYAFSPAISGPGAVDVFAGTTVLAANNSYTGQTTVSGGTLEVNGSIAASSLLSIGAGATIAGVGSLPTTAVSGGFIAPGSSTSPLGTLTVNGNLQLGNRAIYQVDVGQPGTSDRISVTGATSIGDAGVNIVTQHPFFTPGMHDVILTSAGGVTGTFGNQPQQLPLVTLSLSYDANNVYFDVTRNQTPVSALAATPNQSAVGAGVQSLPAGSALSNAVVGQQTVAAVQQALDALSGQSHASLRSSLIEDSRFVRESIYSRLHGAMIGYGLDGTYTADLPSRKGAPPVSTVESASGITMWGNAFGSWSNRERTAEDASLKRSIGGFLLGADKAIGTQTTIGIAGGYSRSDFSVRGRNADADVDNYHVAIYGGTMLGNWALRGGAAYTWQEIDVDRGVFFPGFADRLKASYSAATAQVFGEVGYKLALGSVALEPFVGMAYVNLDTDRFTERGGAAALSARGSTDNVGFTTLGLRAQTQFMIGNGMNMTARGMVGWRHAFGDVDPATTVAFVAGGLPHSVAGLPVARNAAVVEAGLDLNINAAMKLGVSYSGQISDKVQDHGVKGSFIWQF